MGCLEGSGVPVLYIGRTVRQGSTNFISSCGILQVTRYTPAQFEAT
jgi:hypothetical protein